MRATWPIAGAMALMLTASTVDASPRGLCVVVSGSLDVLSTAIADDIAAGLRARVEPDVLEVTRCEDDALADWRLTLALGDSGLSLLLADHVVVLLEHDIAKARSAPRKASRTAVLLVAEALRPAIAVRPSQDPPDEIVEDFEQPEEPRVPQDQPGTEASQPSATSHEVDTLAFHLRFAAGARFGVSPTDVTPGAALGLGVASRSLLAFVGIDGSLVGPAERAGIRATGLAVGIGPRFGIRTSHGELVFGPTVRVVVLGLEGENPLLTRSQRSAVGASMTASGGLWLWRHHGWRLGFVGSVDTLLVGQRFLVDSRPILETSTVQVLVGPSVTWDAHR